MKYLVTGATGQLGYDIVQELERRGLTYIAPTREDMPLEDDKRIEAYAEHFAYNHPNLSFFVLFIGMPILHMC